ncbi:MAG: adenylate/guanylate cyclase domain-containing protein, partial [SAR324 cluster bacterium]|nr:adenylate/guanylate cyclase domain-containing protein [SAR324 cluster bacterium]
MNLSLVERKLAAILSADVVGYSRLMRHDEPATVATLREYREVFTEAIEDHRGRVVDAKGDAILAEFPSVVTAVACAVVVQEELARRNEELASERKMRFRIGVNLGDVIVEDDAIYGDGVNIAARLESLAEPGGVWIARNAFDQVDGKIPVRFEYTGEHTVKNIDTPVRAYKVLLDGKGTEAPAAAAEEAAKAKPALELPERPSIAVMPFENMSGDAEQEYFADGITEDIITDLS